MTGQRRGTLFVVGTPIGNLSDITLRARETLTSVEHVVAEDTRRTKALLSHLGVANKKLHSAHAHTGPGKLERLLLLLEQGHDLALVTDAGMPGVSDPGAALVSAAHAAGLVVSSIPGPSAVTTAASVSGLVDGPFSFLGFLPRKGGRRKAALDRVRTSSEPSILFESPHRTHTTLRELALLMPEREAAVCRELTKLHEEIVRGPLRDLAGEREWRGEVVIVIAGGAVQPRQADVEDLEVLIRERLEAGQSVRSIVDELGPTGGLPQRELYAQVLGLQKTLDD